MRGKLLVMPPHFHESSSVIARRCPPAEVTCQCKGWTLFPIRINLQAVLEEYLHPHLDIWKLLTALLLILILAACQPAQPTTLPSASLTVGEVPSTLFGPPSPAATDSLPANTPLPSPTSKPTATLTPTPLVCWGEGSTIETGLLETDLLRQPLEYRVALPPCYDELSEQDYPVLYLIHGQSFTEDQWQRLGASEITAELVARGELPAFIIVMPRDQLWLEPTEDAFGQVVAESLVPYIDATYRTLSERTFRAIGGLSRGGAWALHLGLVYWQTFGAVGMHSGFAFQSDISHIKRWLDEIPLEEMPRFYLDLSDNDRPEIAQSATWFERLLTARGIPHEWYLFPGYHEEAYWSAHVEQYLRWYAEVWK